MTDENPKQKDNPFRAFQAPSTTEKQEADMEQAVSRNLLLQLQKTERFFQGPLPHPEILAQYEQIVPECAKDIIELFLKQANHRMDLEKMVVEGDSKRADWGIWCGFIIALVVLGLSYVLITKGFPISGTILGALDLATLVGVFIYGTSSRREERMKKAMMAKKAKDTKSTTEDKLSNS